MQSPSADIYRDTQLLRCVLGDRAITVVALNANCYFIDVILEEGERLRSKLSRKIRNCATLCCWVLHPVKVNVKAEPEGFSTHERARRYIHSPRFLIIAYTEFRCKLPDFNESTGGMTRFLSRFM